MLKKATGLCRVGRQQAVYRGLSSNRYCWRTSQLTASGEPFPGMQQSLTSLTKNPYPSNIREREVIYVLLGRGCCCRCCSSQFD
jgi:hypothetical protein